MRSLRRRPTHSTIHYHGRTDTSDDTASLTFSINGVRYEYHLRPQSADDCLHILKVASTGKALAHAKRHAIAFERIGESAVTRTLLRHRGAQASRAKRLKVSLPNV